MSKHLYAVTLYRKTEHGEQWPVFIVEAEDFFVAERRAKEELLPLWTGFRLYLVSWVERDRLTKGEFVMLFEPYQEARKDQEDA
jgi:hypothetical protein